MRRQCVGTLPQLSRKIIENPRKIILKQNDFNRLTQATFHYISVNVGAQTFPEPPHF